MGLRERSEWSLPPPVGSLPVVETLLRDPSLPLPPLPGCCCASGVCHQAQPCPHLIEDHGPNATPAGPGYEASGVCHPIIPLAAFRVVAAQAESAYQALGFTCRFQRMLYRVEKAWGVFKDGDSPKHAVVTVGWDSLL